MFYDFNRHRRKVAQNATRPKADATTNFAVRVMALQRQLADLLGKKVNRLPTKWQKRLYLTAATAATAYCIALLIPGNGLNEMSRMFESTRGTSKSIQIATPSPIQQGFESYLDSLERAWIADSIYQSQQTTGNHAQQSIHP